MSSWRDLPRDEAALMNPAFISLLIAEMARGYEATASCAAPYVHCFVAVPLLLHRITREALPRSVRTSFAGWIIDNPRGRIGFATRARVVVPHVREAIAFGVSRGVIEVDSGGAVTCLLPERRLLPLRCNAASEVAVCLRRAMFIGRWLGNSGEPSMVMALLGVRP